MNIRYEVLLEKRNGSQKIYECEELETAFLQFDCLKWGLMNVPLNEDITIRLVKIINCVVHTLLRYTIE